MYRGTKRRVLVGYGMSEEFNVNISLRQGSSLSPLMLIMVMELVSRKVSLMGSMVRMLYADDLVVVVVCVCGQCRKYWGSGRWHLGSMG